MAFAEQFQFPDSTNRDMGKTMRTHTFKVIRLDDGRSEFYDLRNDSFETENLLLNPLSPQQQASHDGIVRRMDMLLATEH